MSVLMAVISLILSMLSILKLFFDNGVYEFSSKTAYRYCGLTSFVDRNAHQLQQCHLVHVNALYRHGTRNPSKKDTKSFESLHDRLLKSKTHGGTPPDEILDHPIPFRDTGNKELLPRGYEELDKLGRAMRQQMLKHFTFTDANVKIVSSSINRSIASGLSFYNGLFGEEPFPAEFNRRLFCPEGENLTYCLLPNGSHTEHSVQERRMQINDTLLRFFALCDRYVKEIDKNKSTLIEHNKFANSSALRTVFKNFIERFNLTEFNFTKADLRIAYRACAYEIAARSDDSKYSPWCTLLDPHNDYAVLEYWDDLKQYWHKAYGYELNYVSSCPLIGQILTELRDAAAAYKTNNYNRSSENLHRGTFSFGHAETLLPVVTAFGIFNDSVGHDTLQKLTADGFEKRLTQIKMNPPPPTMFRTGHISPFAGNMAFMLYYCPDENDFFVEILVNERTVAWPLAGTHQPPDSTHPGSTNTRLSTVLNYFSGCMPGNYSENKECSINLTEA